MSFRLALPLLRGSATDEESFVSLFWGHVDLGLSNLYSYLSIRLYALLWVGPGSRV